MNNFEISDEFHPLEKSKTFMCENQDKLIEDFENVKNITCMDEIHPEPANNKNFSILSENSSIDINGKVFKYFEKSVLCQISVKTFEEIIKKIEKFKSCNKKYFYFNLKECLRSCFGCQKFTIEDRDFIKKVLEFCQSQFDFSNEIHLSLLLGAYCSVTGERDWPNNDDEWLNMGFSSTDLNIELQSEGLIGLLCIFFLSVYFPNTLKEMLMVQRYYSYEVFKVCKYFAEDAIDIFKHKKLHRFFDGKSKPLDVIFFFCTGMVINWFSYMIKNKDFDETYAKVLKKAKKNPKKYVKIAKKNYSKALYK